MKPLLKPTRKPTTRQLIREALVLTAFGLAFLGILVVCHYISRGM